MGKPIVYVKIENLDSGTVFSDHPELFDVVIVNLDDEADEPVVTCGPFQAENMSTDEILKDFANYEKKENELL